MALLWRDGEAKKRQRRNGGKVHLTWRIPPMLFRARLFYPPPFVFFSLWTLATRGSILKKYYLFHDNFWCSCMNVLLLGVLCLCSCMYAHGLGLIYEFSWLMAWVSSLSDVVVVPCRDIRRARADYPGLPFLYPACRALSEVSYGLTLNGYSLLIGPVSLGRSSSSSMTSWNHLYNTVH